MRNKKSKKDEPQYTYPSDEQLEDVWDINACEARELTDAQQPFLKAEQEAKDDHEWKSLMFMVTQAAERGDCEISTVFVDKRKNVYKKLIEYGYDVTGLNEVWEPYLCYRGTIKWGEPDFSPPPNDHCYFPDINTNDKAGDIENWRL